MPPKRKYDQMEKTANTSKALHTCKRGELLVKVYATPRLRIAVSTDDIR
jgi:hypothetical protein